MAIMEGEDDDFVPSLGISVPKNKEPAGEPEESTRGKRDFSTRDQNIYDPDDPSAVKKRRDQTDAKAKSRYKRMIG